MANINWAAYRNPPPSDPYFYQNAGYLPEWNWFNWPMNILATPDTPPDSSDGENSGGGQGNGGSGGISQLLRNPTPSLYQDRNLDMGIGSIGTEIGRAGVRMGDPYRAAQQWGSTPGTIGSLAAGQMFGPGFLAGKALSTAGFTELETSGLPFNHYSTMMRNNPTYNGLQPDIAAKVEAIRALAAQKNKSMFGINTNNPLDLISAAANSLYRNVTQAPWDPSSRLAPQSINNSSGINGLMNNLMQPHTSPIDSAARRRALDAYDRDRMGPQTADGRDLNSPGEQAAARGEFGVQHGW